MAGGKARWIVVLVACGLLAALAFPAVAPAQPGLLTGFFDVGPAAERATNLDRMVEARAGIVRIHVFWSSVAGGPQRPPDPTNPSSASYDFTSTDAAVRAVEARGLAVMLTVFGAPPWAEGPGRPASAAPGTWKPNPSDLADFSRAVAARYRGGFDPDGSGPAPPLPAVQALQVWNEPNLPGTGLAAQFEGTTAVSVETYRNMLNASYTAVKAVAPQIQVVTAGTGPFGDPPGGPYPSGGARVRPVQFWEELLCVHPVKKKGKEKKKKKKGGSQVKFVRTQGCPAPTRFDVFAHHPINNTGAGPRQSAINPNDATTPDLGRLVRVLRGAERAGTVLPGSHPVWATELWWDSNPPNLAGSPLGVQARWIEESMYLVWKAGANVVINVLVRDTPIGEGLYPVNTLSGEQSGIFFADGRPKPSYTAFRFPFVTERINKGKLRAWGKSPEAGKLKIQRRRGKRWTTVKKLNVGQGAVFTAKLPLRGKQRLRAAVAGNQSLVWKQG